MYNTIRQVLNPSCQRAKIKHGKISLYTVFRRKQSSTTVKKSSVCRASKNGQNYDVTLQFQVSVAIWSKGIAKVKVFKLCKSNFKININWSPFLFRQKGL